MKESRFKVLKQFLNPAGKQQNHDVKDRASLNVKKKITGEQVNRMMDDAIELGYVDSIKVHQHVKMKLGDYEYTKEELWKLECMYEKSHPGIYAQIFYTIEVPAKNDPYATDGIRFAYHFPKHKVYCYGFHSVPGGFGWSYSGDYRLTDWDYLYAEAQKYHKKGSLEKEIWEKVQNDMKIHSQEQESYLKFLKLVKD